MSFSLASWSASLHELVLLLDINADPSFEKTSVLKAAKVLTPRTAIALRPQTVAIAVLELEFFLHGPCSVPSFLSITL